ncbi:hypothetical protein VTK73DRAFT_9910 [Phialemonium thermophilum]|uniref:NADP-dependent oxidoreductase domain-containing protein n=1 Tax=Phialemonium thermophilum TaxID=223376 RepID=A0ABR3XID6_9PEZI
MESPSEHQQFDFTRLGPLVMGSAGFSYQLNADPESLPLERILLRAFDLGLRTIDTSPYYEPSEQLFGAALSSPTISSEYKRGDYILMTKAGRIKEKEFNYSPDWIRKSVARSLQRFNTTYLDVVFCHDVEFVSIEEAVTAVATLVDIKERTGAIKAVGISGYRIDVLVEVARLARERFGRPVVEIVQNWAQLTLQNTRLEQVGFQALRETGVRAVVCSSPLAVGLLRYGGIPVGRTGDWHPAPQGLRAAAQKAAQWVHGRQDGHSMSQIAMRFAVSLAAKNSRPGFMVTTASGISSLRDLEENVATTRSILHSATGKNNANQEEPLVRLTEVDEVELARDKEYYDGIRAILGGWVDFDFADSAPKNAEIHEKEAGNLKRETINARI